MLGCPFIGAYPKTAGCFFFEYPVKMDDLGGTPINGHPQIVIKISNEAKGRQRLQVVRIQQFLGISSDLIQMRWGTALSHVITTHHSACAGHVIL